MIYVCIHNVSLRIFVTLNCDKIELEKVRNDRKQMFADVLYKIVRVMDSFLVLFFSLYIHFDGVVV